MDRDSQSQSRRLVSLALLLLIAAAVRWDYHGLGTLARSASARMVEVVGQERSARALKRVSDALKGSENAEQAEAQNSLLAVRAELLREQNLTLAARLEDPIRIPSLETGRDRLMRLLETRTSATVLGPAPLRWTRTLLLDVGKANNVHLGDAVIDGPNLVGVVVWASVSTCTVRLIDDPASQIEARCARTEECIGIMRGIPGGELVIEEMPAWADVREGDTILSSSLGGQLPDGLIIGRLVAYHRFTTAGSPETSYAWSYLEPAVDLDTLSTVSVLRTSAERVDTDGS